MAKFVSRLADGELARPAQDLYSALDERGCARIILALTHFGACSPCELSHSLI